MDKRQSKNGIQKGGAEATRKKSSLVDEKVMDSQSAAFPQYAAWLQSLSRRYRQSQIKAAFAVNVEMLKFYFELGADIVRMEKEEEGAQKYA